MESIESRGDAETNIEPAAIAAEEFAQLVFSRVFRLIPFMEARIYHYRGPSKENRSPEITIQKRLTVCQISWLYFVRVRRE
jgi:hypothetical protein